MDQHLRYENQRQSCEVTDLLAAIAKCQLCFPGLVSKDVPRQEPLRGKTRSERRDNFLFLYELAIREPRLAGCVVNYGALPMRTAELASIDAPVLGNFGVLDRSIPVARVRAFEAAMRGLGKSVDIKLYEGAGHAFENPDNKRGYRPEAAADASLRTLDFLAREAPRASPGSAGSAAPSLPTRCRR
jgi:acetyl esterase/lipase